jgi:chorismate mutase-like protein
MSSPAKCGYGAAVPATIEELQALRAKLDRIDERLLDSLRDRIACSMDIADVKRRHDMPVLQPQRGGEVQQRAARLAAENGIDGHFVHRVYALIMEESCRVQEVAIRGLAPVAPSARPALGKSGTRR